MGGEEGCMLNVEGVPSVEIEPGNDVREHFCSGSTMREVCKPPNDTTCHDLGVEYISTASCLFMPTENYFGRDIK